MKNSFAMAAALAAGIGIGSFGVHALHAQTKPPVYMIEAREETGRPRAG